MKAITLHQPWASLIGNSPLKNIENRTWRPPASVLGQRIAIHAGKTHDYAVERAVLSAANRYDKANKIRNGAQKLYNRARTILDDEDMPHGAIVSTAVLAGWYDSATDKFSVPWNVNLNDIKLSPWFFGPVGWLFTDVVRLREPIPCKGAQGLWTVPTDIEERISR